ncbi:Ig-like domain-containing protein [Serinibacter arcticus]|uniref:Ig-like domain-containing protein n=1 Tax=Serinibacter arcticus TaxID=1655435 RepID=UPI0011B23481|nr:Ig-like domain-containing protein [Serinibacter arcticus]
MGSSIGLGLTAAPALAAETVTITPNPWYASEPFEGWGTSLVWFANATGGYPAELREELYQAVFGDEGLNLNIARYNVGGGHASDVVDYLRPGGAVEGWWAADPSGSENTYGGASTAYADRNAVLNAWDPANPDHYNWDADATQRWWIERLVEDDQITHWEAFANSAPYFMTESGYVSGGFNANNEQLKPAADAKFSAYLVAVTEHLEQEYGIEFSTIDPFNEPNTNYWGTTLTNGVPTGGRQEGMHVGPVRQTNVIDALDAELNKPTTTTGALISAMDETNPGTFATNWAAYTAAHRAKVAQMNVHTYGTSGRLVVRDLAKQADTSLWMSEIEGNWVNGWNPLLMENGLGIASRINDDLRELEPNAWVLWQPVEDLYNMDQPAPRGENLNWGSVFIDLDCKPYVENGQEVWKSPRRVALAGGVSANAPECSVEVNSKYNTLRNYTHFISPGDALIPTTSTTTTAAVAADGQSTTLVHSNAAATEQTVVVDLSKFGTIDADATLTAHVTTQAPSLAEPTANALVEQAPVAVDVAARTATYTVPAKSVTTFVIDGVSGVADDAAALEDGGTYQLVGQQSGRALSAETSGLTIRTLATTATAAARQTFTVHEVDTSSADQDATRSYVLEDDQGRYLGATSAGIRWSTGTLDQAKADPSSTWILNTTNGSTWSFVNAGLAQSLDVAGQSSADGTSVGVYGSNGGANQTWSIRNLEVLPTEVAVRTNPGVAPVLPATVAPRYSWGSGSPVPVTWDAFDDASWATPGIFQVAGTATDVHGSAVAVTATVEVAGLSVTDPASITVARGTAASAVVASLPTTVKARAGGSSLTLDAPVTWDTAALTDASFVDTGVVTVRGTATADGATLPALVSVIVTEPSGTNIAPAATTTASASSTEGSFVVDRTRNGNRTDKGWSNWVSSNKPATSTLTYQFPEKSILGTDVYFYADGSATSWAQTMRVEYRTPAGVWTRAPGYETDRTVVTPPAGAPIVEADWSAVRATGIRVVMNAYANTHLTVSEVEIFEVAPSPSGVADLASLRIDGAEVALTAGTLDYTATSTGSAFPVVQAFGVDQAARVTVTQPTAGDGGVATVVVTPPNGPAATYTLTIERIVDVGVAFDVAPVTGQPVTAVVTTDPADAELVYAWTVDGEIVAGATGATYTPTVVGSTLAVEVTASADGLTDGTAGTSAPVGDGTEPITFADVTPETMFATEIAWLAQRGISTGWELPDGTREFRPVTPVARDAMAAFLYRLAGSPAYVAPEVSPFVDVPTSNQFYEEIAWLAEEGISTGWDNGDGTASFRPLAPIARDAMAAFLFRYADVTSYDAPTTSAFADVTPANQFYREISWLAEKGISTGWDGSGNDGSSIFRPLASVNRDAMAAFMFRLDNLE